MTEKIAMTVEEAADFTGIGRNTLRQLISWKTMPTIKVGRKVLIRTQDLDRFLELNRNTDLRNQAEVIPLTGYVKSNRADFIRPFTPPYVPFGIRRFKSTSTCAVRHSTRTD